MHKEEELFAIVILLAKTHLYCLCVVVILVSEPYTFSLQNQSQITVTNIGHDSSLLDESLLESQKQWLRDTKLLILKDKLENTDYASWGAYFGSQAEALTTPNMISSSLPIHLEKASDPAMIAKVMFLAQSITEALNPGQCPWLETDEPLYHKT